MNENVPVAGIGAYSCCVLTNSLSHTGYWWEKFNYVL